MTAARNLDRADPLRVFRRRFLTPRNRLYFMGNSLGLPARGALRRLEDAAHEWASLGVDGWNRAAPPWFGLAERIGERAAPLLGAAPDEVVVAAPTTVNVHALVSTFYRPSGRRTRILADAHNFPTDIYALRSQIALRGGDPASDLVLAGADGAALLDEGDIIARMDDRVALVFLSAVTYRAGQLLDIATLAREAASRDIPIGFDCSHAGGVLPLQLTEWGVDFAVCCSYKYLGGGPGSPALLYVNRRRFGTRPALAGWFGSIKERQFDMALEIAHDPSARGFQIATPPIMAIAPLDGALDVILDAGIEAIRDKSVRMTDYLMALLDERLPTERSGAAIVTPRESGRRGGHVAITHPRAAWIRDQLAAQGIDTDVRPPDTVRVAPAPLYNRYQDVWRLICALERLVS